jgi:hypothetical protein
MHRLREHVGLQLTSRRHGSIRRRRRDRGDGLRSGPSRSRVFPRVEPDGRGRGARSHIKDHVAAPAVRSFADLEPVEGDRFHVHPLLMAFGIQGLSRQLALDPPT